MTGLSYIRSVSERYQIDPDVFKKNDFHIHIPEGADFFIPEKVVELTAIIHLPSNVYITDQMDDFLTENAAHLTFVAPKGSYAESYAQEKGIPIIFE